MGIEHKDNGMSTAAGNMHQNFFLGEISQRKILKILLGIWETYFRTN